MQKFVPAVQKKIAITATLFSSGGRLNFKYCVWLFVTGVKQPLGKHKVEVDNVCKMCKKDIKFFLQFYRLKNRCKTRLSSCIVQCAFIPFISKAKSRFIYLRVYPNNHQLPHQSGQVSVVKFLHIFPSLERGYAKKSIIDWLYQCTILFSFCVSKHMLFQTHTT